MSARSRNLIVLVVGVLILVLGVGADALGVGTSPGLGWKQQLAAAAGAVVSLVGLAGLVRTRG